MHVAGADKDRQDVAGIFHKKDMTCVFLQMMLQGTIRINCDQYIVTTVTLIAYMIEYE